MLHLYSHVQNVNKMENRIALENTLALALAKITANQEQIMRMLSEIIADNRHQEQSDVYKEHLQNAAKAIPDFVNEFLNHFQVEVIRHSPAQ